jgi:23S rRNA (cytosine1962-C5)-methyltransferase
MIAEFKLFSRGRRRADGRHPWIFKDQIETGVATSGAIVRVVDSDRRQLGFATYSAESKIALRFVAFGEHATCPTPADLRARFHAAVARRASLAPITDAMRLVSSEADGFPGLVVDRYREVAVVQALTAFGEYLLPELTAWVRELPGVEAVFARNDASVRKLENLPLETKWLAGEPRERTTIQEKGIRFEVDLTTGQKTGFFLDQRRNRILLGEMVKEGESVLDAFAYTGGFALHAARRAGQVLALDDSKIAAAAIEVNAKANGFTNVTAERGNSFDRLRAMVKEDRRFDVIVLDPPAFAKNKAERDDALRGYHEINVRAMKLLAEGGLLVSASCSYQVDEPSFEDMLRGAAADAGRSFVVAERGRQDIDHPVLLQLLESRYLKCFFLRAV